MRALLTLLTLLPGLALAGEAAFTLKADDLKNEPFRDAQTVQALPANTAVDIIKKQGAWAQVKVGKASGWVRTLSLKTGKPTSAATSAPAKGLLGIASGRDSSGKIVSTTGIRGLADDDTQDKGLTENGLKAATNNEAQITRLESLRVTSDEAKTFAKQGKLTARKQAWLGEKS